MKKVLMAMIVGAMMLSSSVASAATTITLGHNYEYQAHGKHHKHYKKHHHKKHPHKHHHKHHYRFH